VGLKHPKVHLEGLRKEYGSVTAVDGIDLTVHEGEFLTLLGPSGCGKTTTLMMMAGFETPTEGRILIDGQDVTHKPAFQRPLNTVFQNYALFPHMTIFDNVAFGLRMRRLPEAEVRRRVYEHLEMVQLRGFERRYPWQLSGGQQQRVALARAIVNSPRVLLLDEPLGALDLKLRREMQGELKKLQRHLGITFIYVTHDQDEALSMSDRIAVMNRGRIEQLGTAAEIYERPRSRFVAEFIGETNLLPARIVEQRDRSTLVDILGIIGRLTTHRYPQSEVYASIRPERIRLASSDEPGVEGRVWDTVYAGPVVQVLVHIPGTDEPLQVIAPPGTHLARVYPGEAVRLTWDSEDVVLVA